MKRVHVPQPIWSFETTLDEPIFSWWREVAPIRRIVHYRITVDGHCIELYRNLPLGWFRPVTIKNLYLGRLREE